MKNKQYELSTFNAFRTLSTDLFLEYSKTVSTNEKKYKTYCKLVNTDDVWNDAIVMDFEPADNQKDDKLCILYSSNGYLDDPGHSYVISSTWSKLTTKAKTSPSPATNPKILHTFDMSFKNLIRLPNGKTYGTYKNALYQINSDSAT